MSDQERPCGCLFKGYEVVSQCIYHTGRQNLIESLEKFRHDAKVENAELHSQIESIQRENEELKRYVNEAERLFRMYGLSSPPRKGHEWPNTGGMGDE